MGIGLIVQGTLENPKRVPKVQGESRISQAKGQSTIFLQVSYLPVVFLFLRSGIRFVFSFLGRFCG